MISIKMSYDTFINSKTLENEIPKALADILLDKIGGWEAFLSLAPSIHSPLDVGLLEGFSEDADLLALYTKHKDLFLCFLRCCAKKDGQDNEAIWLHNRISFYNERELNTVAYALYDPLSAVEVDNEMNADSARRHISYACTYGVYRVVEAFNRAKHTKNELSVIKGFYTLLNVQKVKIDVYADSDVTINNIGYENLVKGLADLSLPSHQRYLLINADLAEAFIDQCGGGEAFISTVKDFESVFNLSAIEGFSTAKRCSDFIDDNIADINDFIAKYAISHSITNNVDAVSSMLPSSLNSIGFDATAELLYGRDPKSELTEDTQILIVSIITELSKAMAKAYSDYMSLTWNFGSSKDLYLKIIPDTLNQDRGTD